MKKIDKTKFTVLAIESSCDETAAAVIHATCNTQHVTNLEIKSNIISSQVKLHAKYGGVYPELASREHIRNVIPVIQESLNIAEIPNPKSQISNKFQIKNSKNESLNENCKMKIENSVDAIAVTVGPGLIGSLLVGVNTAKTLAYTLNKPIYGINHLEGHIYSCFAGDNLKFEFRNLNLNKNLKNESLNANLKLKIKNSMPQFPLVALVVSGGHTSLVYMKNHFDYQVIGETLDDAAGEAFDKVAKLLGLSYPGGPAISKLADENLKFEFRNLNLNKNLKNESLNANLKLKIKNCIRFPRPMIKENNFDFSFSGLKTSVLYTVKKLPRPLSSDVKRLICAEFQNAVVETLVTKTLRAAVKYGVKSVLLCGGVSANDELRRQFELGIRNYELGNKSSKKLQATSYKLQFFVPDKKLSTDNAAMIGIAAAYRIALGKIDNTDWKMINADPNLKL